MMGRTWRLAALAVGLAAGAVEAATMYRWTDDRGVVHFADVPPPNVKTYRAEPLPIFPPAAPQSAAGTEASAATGDPEAAAKPATAAVATGPARLVIIDREEVSLGGAVQSFSGKVKNQGGTEAHDVAVAIRVIEPTQGDECVTDEIDVAPANLAPGATGTFEADFNSPCFQGPTQTELRVEWD
jgi:hypothetical protein